MTGKKSVEKKVAEKKAVEKKSGEKVEKQAVEKQAPNKMSRKQKRKLAFSVFLMLLWAGLSVIFSQLIVGWIMVRIMGVDSFLQPSSQAVYSALTYILALFLIVWIPTNLSVKWRVGKKGDGSEKSGGREPATISRSLLGLNGLPTWTDIGLAPVGFIVATLLAAGLALVFNMFPWFNATESQSLVFSTYVEGVDKIIAFITLVVIAPVAEELIFRGWLYGRLRAKSSHAMSNIASMIVSSLLVSVLFGAVHLQWNVGVNVFALSMVLCAMREITGTIYAGILTHMIKNGIAFYLLFVLGVG